MGSRQFTLRNLLVWLTIGCVAFAFPRAFVALLSTTVWLSMNTVAGIAIGQELNRPKLGGIVGFVIAAGLLGALLVAFMRH